MGLTELLALFTVIVVTGGPGSGKTTVIERAKQDSRLRGTLFLSEIAAAVIQRYGLDRDHFSAMRNPAFVRQFQRLVAAECIVALYAALMRAHAGGGVVRVCLDRFTLDGGAYVSGGVPELAEIVGMSIEEMIAGVHRVLYLCPAPEQYYVRNPLYRKEDHPEAVALGIGVRAAWADHHPLGVIDIDSDPELVHDAVASMDSKYEAFVAAMTRA